MHQHGDLHHTCQGIAPPQVLWGDALLRVEEGLSAGRRWLWDEASRKVGTLIAAPSAFQGEHFLQVGTPLPPVLQHGPITTCEYLPFGPSDSSPCLLWRLPAAAS